MTHILRKFMQEVKTMGLLTIKEGGHFNKGVTFEVQSPKFLQCFKGCI